MRIIPIPADGATVLRGEFEFSARSKRGEVIADSYGLEIRVPVRFPKDVPEVRETRGRIPDDQKHHVNPGVGTLCLGSPLRLRMILSVHPTLCGFDEHCLIPFLYAASHKRLHGGSFVFGELPHGNEGVFEEYREVFGLTTERQVCEALRLLGIKKRVANKAVCPCGCGRRLGRCKFRHRLNQLRGVAKRSWFREHYKELISSKRRV